MDGRTRTVSTVVLDFVFGAPMPEPEVLEKDTEQAWQDWLDAMAERSTGDAFENTRPLHLH